MEQNTDTPTVETQVDDSQLKSATGNTAESVATDNQPSADSLSLAEINDITGMSYKDKETALKSIKDLKSQAGKAADLEGKLKNLPTDNNGKTDDSAYNELKEQLNQLQNDNFYTKNPDANRDLVETIAKANGMSREEAMQTELYKNTVAAPEKRTVASSNNRIAQPSSDDFNPADHAGDATALADYVAKIISK